MGMVCKPSAEELLDRLMPTLRQYRKASDRTQHLEQVERDYPDLAEEVGLSEAEADALYEMARAQASALAQVYYTGNNENFTSEVEYAKKELARIQAAEMQALLGPEKYGKWKDYQLSLEARQILGQLRSMVAQSAALADSEAKPLLAIVSSARQRANDEVTTRVTAAPGTMSAFLQEQDIELSRTEAFNQYFLGAARPFLTSQQYAAIRTSLTEFAAGTRRNLEKAVQREASKAKP